MRAPGIYSDVEIDEYHAEDGISSTGISMLLDCPKRYWYAYKYANNKVDLKNSKRQSEKFMLGRAIHLLVLEPNKFEETFFTMTEDVNLTTKIGKELYAKAESEANGRQIIRAQDWREIMETATSVLQHSIWEQFKNGKVEHSVYWDGGIYNARLRCRPDFFNDKIIIDLKTTDSISAFQRSIHSYGYHRQAAMQIDGLASVDGIIRKFAFFVVEKKAPYLTACFVLDEDAIKIGRREYLDAASIYVECSQYDSWPGYEEKLTTISLPKWVIKQGEENE